MKQLLNYLVIILLFLVSCEQQASEDTSTDGADTTEVETSDETTVMREKPSVLNANLATEEELQEAGLTEQQVDQIVNARPFVDPMDFHNTIKATADTADFVIIYEKVFVPFNLNTTPEEDFKIIPGVGDRMAHEFVEYRPYTKMLQFRKEIGKYVDEEEVARLEQYVFVPVELNSATEEDILALPGVGERMAHEFEEYRPYTSLEQFRKEIGKYVDDKELSRLERFVYLEE